MNDLSNRRFGLRLHFFTFQSWVAMNEFIYNAVVTTRVNQSEFELEHNSPVQDNHITGLMVRLRGGESDFRSRGGRNLINDAAAKSAFLRVIHRRNTIVVEDIALWLLHYRSIRGEWFPVNLPHVDLNRSKFIISNVPVIADNEDIELYIRYRKEYEN